MLRLVRSMSRPILLLIATVITASLAAGAEQSAATRLDWSDWQSLPVHDAGRVMPLDTLARSLVEEICGRAHPRLAPRETESADVPGKGRAGPRSVLFPDGKPRRFTAAELVFSWLVEPERWENVPLLVARHESLRCDLLEVPLKDHRGNRLKYISPREFERSAGAAKRLSELARLEQQALEDDRSIALSEADRRLEHLNRAYRAYRVLTFDPRRPRMRRTVFLSRLMDVARTWQRELAQPLALWQALDASADHERFVEQTNHSLRQLVVLLEKEQFSFAAADEHASELCRATRSLAALAAGRRDREFETRDTPDAMQRRRLMNILADRTAQLARQAYALREALYDNGCPLRVVPALSPFALQKNRQMGRAAQPWLALQTLLFGSEAVLEDYPADRVSKVREAFAEAKAAYLDRQAPDRPERFAQAMRRLSDSLRALGEVIEPARRELLADEASESQLAATAYPPVGTMRKEVFYNRLNPFLWAWLLTLASIVCLVLGFGVLRKTMFFLGAALLACGQGLTIAGFALRGAITGMVPITNMYETVLFVAATVALFGLWFALLPLVWPVLGAAWQITAVSTTPRTAAGAGVSADWARWFWRTMPVLRAVLVLLLFYVLAIGHFNPSEDGPIFALLPSFSSATTGGVLGALTIWLVGLGVLAWSLWFFPRAVLTFLVGVALAPKTVRILFAQRLTDPIERTVARGPFLLAGAAVALLAYLLAYYVPGPVFKREVGLGMEALLRSNFWLALHVIVVTASYGAGALAWGLGNISLGYYALGRYRSPKMPSAETLAAGHRPAGDYHAPASAFTRRPPAVCAKLARHIYKSIQVAVLLLAAGTITGAIWADYAWGRYWGWDPKEVWALISLMVYLAVLHGRRAGWTGNFGIAVGAVLGATAIMMAWYGVNFILKGGLHSYGQSTGGEVYVLLCVAANWLLVALAAVRYWIERRTLVEPSRVGTAHRQSP